MTTVLESPKPINLARLDPLALARLCVMAWAEEEPAGQRANLTFWMEGHHPRKQKVPVWHRVQGRILKRWTSPDELESFVYVRVWVDELWAEMKSRRVDLGSVVKEVDDAANDAARRRKEAAQPTGLLGPGGGPLIRGPGRH